MLTITYLNPPGARTSDRLLGLVLILSLSVGTACGQNVVSTPVWAVPTVAAAPTRPPEGPSFTKACRTFQLLVQDVEAGRVDDFGQRSARFEQLRQDAEFPGSPDSFLALINAYTDAVDERLGIGPGSTMEPLTEMDIADIDRAIRRARDDLLSECRARRK